MSRPTMKCVQPAGNGAPTKQHPSVMHNDQVNMPMNMPCAGHSVNLQGPSKQHGWLAQVELGPVPSAAEPASSCCQSDKGSQQISAGCTIVLADDHVLNGLAGSSHVHGVGQVCPADGGVTDLLLQNLIRVVAHDARDVVILCIDRREQAATAAL